MSNSKSKDNDKYKHYVNRDLSWLQFNERVLEEAEDPNNPLFERLNFVAIYHSNLTEFLRVRVGSLYDQLLVKKDVVDPRSGMTVEEQIRAINERITSLSPRRNKALKKIMKELARHGIRFQNGPKFTKAEQKFLEEYFDRDVRPFLSPHVVDKHHPFPFLENNTVYVVVLLKSKSGTKRLGIVPCSGYFEHFLKLPNNKETRFTLIENLIYMYADKIFPKHEVIDRTIISVTRNADIDETDIDEKDTDYIELVNRENKGNKITFDDDMELLVKKRTKLAPIRLDMIRSEAPEIRKRLMEYLNLRSDQVFFNELPIKLGFVSSLKDLIRKKGGHEDLFYPKLSPQKTNKVSRSEPLIPQIRKKDLLLSYPYEDIGTFVKLLEEAAEDPDVVNIRITLYRVARNSRIVDALIQAAENGKEVTAVVELRARFDEENNLEWAERLEKAGVMLVYGIPKYKVHSKLMVITRKNETGLEFITQIGTGNYNEVTSRLYTDLSFMTADEDIARDAINVFQNLGSGTLVEESDKLMVSPLTLKPKVLKLIDEEIAEAKAGRPAMLQFKMNSLNDMQIIDKLIEASDAGVKIKLLIRGICCLKTSKTGATRNIEITSIVGRYLEHSRIYIFGTGDREKIYIASADFMTRNTDNRVEVGVPVTDEDAKKELKDIMNLMLSDNVKARREAGGKYEHVRPEEGEPRIDSQIRQSEWAYSNAGKPFPEALKSQQ